MRSNAAVYVDAGYLLASAATRLTGSSFRKGIQPDFPLLIGSLLEQTGGIAGRSVLRLYWYDASSTAGPEPDQRIIEMIHRVKLRLGRVGNEGQQKGVDLKMGLDMVTHARNGSVDTIILLSGDDDLTEAVDQAQVNGVEVIVLAVPDASGKPHGVSRHLNAAADRLELVDGEALDRSIVKRVASATPAEVVTAIHAASESTAVGAGEKKPPHPSPADVAHAKPAPPRKVPSSQIPAPSPVWTSTTGVAPTHNHEPGQPYAEIDETTRSVVKVALHAFLDYATDAQVSDLKRNRPSIPQELDSTLLRDLSDAIGVYSLSDAQRYALRDAFWEAVDAL